MNRCAIGSWPRRTAIRWPCWSCRGGLTPAQLAGGFGLPGVAALPAASRKASLGGWRRCPRATRRLLLLAAAEPLGDSALLLRAADPLGIKAEAADAAEAEGLVEFCVQVTFRHPLVRSAIYRSASPQAAARGASSAGGGDRCPARSRPPGVALRPGGTWSR